MYEKIPTVDMDDKEWLALRKTGIGGFRCGNRLRSESIQQPDGTVL